MTMEEWMLVLEKVGAEALAPLSDWAEDEGREDAEFWKACRDNGWYPHLSKASAVHNDNGPSWDWWNRKWLGTGENRLPGSCGLPHELHVNFPASRTNRRFKSQMLSKYVESCSLAEAYGWFWEVWNSSQEKFAGAGQSAAVSG